MNIQIFVKKKCFDSKKAERWFKERRIAYQRVDLDRFGMSRGEFESVCRAVGGVENLIDPNSRAAGNLRWLEREEDRVDALLDDPTLLRTPVVRNGKQATAGYCPEVWETWLQK